MNSQDKRRIREIREQIVARYPQIENAPDIFEVLEGLPIDDPLAGVEFEDPLKGVHFPDDVATPDYPGMTDHARRVLDAIGDFQHGQPLDRFPRCA